MKRFMRSASLDRHNSAPPFSTVYENAPTRLQNPEDFRQRCRDDVKIFENLARHNHVKGGVIERQLVSVTRDEFHIIEAGPSLSCE
jgi:hypothetical protein